MTHSKRVKEILFLLAAVALMAPLAVYALTGTNARYWADDYCQSGDIFAEGFWRAQVVTYMKSSDRFSVEPLIGVSELFGPRAMRVWPALVIVFWLAGMFWALRQGARLFRIPLSWGGALCLAAGVVFFTLLEAPNRYQSLYWRAGLFTYLLPLVLNTWLAGLVMRQLRRPAGEALPWIALVGVGLLAFYAGGLSETSAAAQTTWIVLAGLSAWRRWRAEKETPARVVKVLGTALAASLLAMFVLFLSPAGHMRQENFGPPPDIFTIIAMSADFALDFMRDLVVVLPLPGAVSLVLAALVSFSLYDDNQRPEARLWVTVLRMVLAVLVCYVLCMSFIAPSIYAYRAAVEGRAAIVGRLVTVASTFWLGWLVGDGMRWLVSRLRPPFAHWGLLAALLACALMFYPLRSAVQAIPELREYQQRAAQWDARDQEIRGAISRGEQDIEVVELDSIGTLADMKEDPELWINQCAARYYGIRSITTFLP